MSMIKNFEDIQEGDSLILEIGTSEVSGNCAVKLGPFGESYQIFVRTPNASSFPPFWVTVNGRAHVYWGSVDVEYKGIKVKISTSREFIGLTKSKMKDVYADVIVDDGKTTSKKTDKAPIEEEEEEEELAKVTKRSAKKEPPRNEIEAHLATLCNKMIVSIGKGIKLSKIAKDAQGRECKIGPLPESEKAKAKDMIKSAGFKYIKEKKDGDNFYIQFRPW